MSAFSILSQLDSNGIADLPTLESFLNSVSQSFINCVVG